MASRIVQYFADKLKSMKEYPITLTKAVYDKDGNRLDNILGDINSSLSDFLSKTKIKTVAYTNSTDANGGSVLYADESKTIKLNPSQHIILSVGGTLENGQVFFNIISSRDSDYLAKAISATSGSSLTVFTNTNINWKVTYLELN